MTQPIIEFKQATLGYGRNVVLTDISFAINIGDYFGLVGPNGAGKTTLVRAILGTLKPMTGEVVVRNPAPDTLRFGYVPQRDTIDLVLPYTVSEVVMMGRYKYLGLFRYPRQEDRRIVQESLEHVGIGDLANNSFRELSGGQKQRSLIARALASRPAVLVLDEPTNGMDLSSRDAILELVHTLHQEDQLTVIMVSHLLDDVANYVKRIAFVEPNFFQVGQVDEVLTEENLSSVYKMPVTVSVVAGRTVIRPGIRDGK